MNKIDNNTKLENEPDSGDLNDDNRKVSIKELLMESTTKTPIEIIQKLSPSTPPVKK